MSAGPTACVLIIGNEILSGKTQDTNLQFLGLELAKLGIRLAEGRVVRDEPAAIIRHLNETRREFTYVFTTGGIGPTHDDITAECVAQAFGVPLEQNDDAVARLKRSGRPLNEARLKMARIPRGAELVDNPVSNAPGFRIENVFVFAGIPSIARAMFANAVPLLVHGAPILSASVDAFLREGDFADALTSIQQHYPTVEIGSYPFNRDGNSARRSWHAVLTARCSRRPSRTSPRRSARSAGKRCSLEPSTAAADRPEFDHNWPSAGQDSPPSRPQLRRSMTPQAMSGSRSMRKFKILWRNALSPHACEELETWISVLLALVAGCCSLQR